MRWFRSDFNIKIGLFKLVELCVAASYCIPILKRAQRALANGVGTTSAAFLQPAWSSKFSREQFSVLAIAVRTIVLFACSARTLSSRAAAEPIQIVIVIQH
jgi:hypothetical protein